MSNDSTVGSRFVVDLGAVKLQPIQEQRVAADIQAVVLRTLAQNDSGANLASHSLLPPWDQFPGQTLGLWPKDSAPPIWAAAPHLIL
jgi:hypothetical protein